MEKDNQEHWYALRVTYGRELKVQAALEGKYKTFIPKCYKITERFGHRKYELTSAVNNLIFIYTTEEELKKIKKFNAVNESLRYIMDANTNSPMYVRAKQMEDFIRVNELPEEKLFLLDLEEGETLHGKKVRIIEGELSGIEGKIMRIQGNKKVVVSVDGIIAIGITFIPPSYLMKID